MTEPLLAGIDIETTGFLAPDHRIIEVYLGLWRGEKLIWEFEQRIDPQRGIAADAERVHKISSAMLVGMPTWDKVAPGLLKAMERADGYVWQNGDEFDGPFLDQEFKRVGLPGLPARPAIDTMNSGVWATHDGKKPRLEELCFACGVDYDTAASHAAAYDVKVMMECYLKGLKWGFFPSIELPAVSSADAA